MADVLDLIPLQFTRLSPDEQQEQLARFAQTMAARRSIRDFTGTTVNLEVIREAIRTAGTAPSGANLQPWHYVVVTDPATKRALREAAEHEEGARRAGLPPAWLQGAPPAPKGFLEEAPCLIALFRVNYTILPDGKQMKHYYAPESAALSASFLLAALQHAGVQTLVHAPVAAMASILGRPRNESPCLLVACGAAPGGGDLAAARNFYERMRTRRVIREFNPEPVPLELVQQALAVANTAPSGAGLKPWHFELVTDAAVKSRLRELAEQEEKLFYETRITPEWRAALAPLGTDWEKPFLEIAPHLIVCFKVNPELDPNVAPPHVDSSLKGGKAQYTLESAGLAAGLLIAGLHHAGLVCLTHTPSPMNFLRRALNRPANETPFLLLPVGYPTKDCQVPNIHKKPLEQILTIM